MPVRGSAWVISQPNTASEAPRAPATPRGRFHRSAVPTMSIQAPELQARPSHGCPSMSLHQLGCTGLGDQVHGFAELAAQQVERIADAEHVVVGLAVEEVGGGRQRQALAVEGRHQAGLRVLQAQQPVTLLLGGQLRRRPPEQQVRDLDGVALCAYGGRLPRSVDEQAAPYFGVPGAGDDSAGLLPGAADERGKALAQVRLAVPAARSAGGTRQRSTRAGLPPTTAPAGTSLVTTAPAAITALSPTLTPSRITTWDPIQTSLPMVMPRDEIGCRKTSRSGSVMVWLKAKDRGVGADPDGVAERDRAAHHHEGVHSAVAPGPKRAR